jgi:NAD(P)-dependent dehydrogenase (short-subunit alcohol dehydrogenase family)
LKTVLITGCSSGFGLETARYFLTRGWRVVATMRTPRTDILPASPDLTILPLDVTDAGSISRAIAAAGPIDVLVNNAGIGLLNALEGNTPELIRQTFETNTFGTMTMTQAVLPQMRERLSGTVINVTSSVTLKPLHLLSVYTASKAAVNAFSSSLALELEPFNIRVRVVAPGRAPETRFGENARARMAHDFPDAYAALAGQIFARWQQDTLITGAHEVAEAIWRAATDPACPDFLPAGADAVALAAAG